MATQAKEGENEGTRETLSTGNSKQIHRHGKEAGGKDIRAAVELLTEKAWFSSVTENKVKLAELRFKLKQHISQKLQ